MWAAETSRNFFWRRDGRDTAKWIPFTLQLCPFWTELNPGITIDKLD